MHLDNLEFRSALVDFQRRDGTSIGLLITQVWQRRLSSLWEYLLGKSTAVELNFPNTLAGQSSLLTVDLPGVARGEFARVAPIDAALVIASSFYQATVTADGVVTVLFVNASAGAINPPAGDFNIWVNRL